MCVYSVLHSEEREGMVCVCVCVCVRVRACVQCIAQ